MAVAGTEASRARRDAADAIRNRLQKRPRFEGRMRWPAARLSAIVGTVAALLSFVSAPFHGAAYFATEDGSTDLFAHQSAWGEAVRDAFPVLFDGDTYATYIAFGKVTALVVALFAVAMAGLHGLQDATLGRARRMTGRVVVTLWAVFAVAVVAEYFTPYTDEVFVVALPVLLLLIVLTAVYGWMTAKAAALPRRVGWALFGAAVAFIPLVVLAGHMPVGFYGFSLAWLAVVAPALGARGTARVT